MKKKYGDYYLGLDIGTNSVGWAVTDEKYNILKSHGKAMWEYKGKISRYCIL